MAKAKTTVSIMAELLMEGAILGSIMPGWKAIRERPKVKGFEVALSYKDLKSFRQGHVKGIEDVVTSPGSSDRRVGRC
ncbi:hypothetical protein CsSME_00035684 [Camellia sinensis var. sinensis]